MNIVEINHEIQELEHKIWLIRVGTDMLQESDRSQIDQYKLRIEELRKMRAENGN